jgi:hypothetical protein
MRIAVLAAVVVFVVAGAITATAAPAVSGPAGRLAVLPFVNRSGSEGAGERVLPTVTRRLSSLGYALVPAADVEAFLEEKRVRYLDSLSEPILAELLKRFDASGVVSGTVFALSDGTNPIAGLTARLALADGSLAWAGTAGLTAEDTEGLLGLGRARSLAILQDRTIDALLAGFPAPGGKAKVASRGKPLALASPATFRSASLAQGVRHRVCLLPLENFTPSREAPWLVGETLAQRLALSETFEVIPAADFRAAVLAEKIRGFRDLDPDALKRLGARLGTPLFLRGTIYKFRETSPTAALQVPEAEIQIELVDVGLGRIVWTSSLARRGDQYRGLLQRGALTNIVALADQMAAEMVRAAEKAPLKSHPNGSGHADVARSALRPAR